MTSIRSKSQKTKSFSAMLACLLLVSAFMMSLTVPVKAPVTEPIKLYAVTTQNDGPGYYGGYYPILVAIKTELAKIGIDLEIFRQSETGWYVTVWEPPTWNRTGDWDGDGSHTVGVDGWDFTTCEWWLNPTSYIWMDELVYSWNNPPKGYNIMSWSDSKIDDLWKTAQTTLDPAEHKQYMWLWQEEVMHNPPVIPLYYADQWTARAAYVDGFDETAWVYDLSHLSINEAKFNEVVTPGSIRAAYTSNTILWGAVEPIYYLFPLGVNTYTEEQLNVLKQGILYRTSRENMAFPASGNYIVEPGLATGFPVWRQVGNQWVARVPIVSGLTWSDGVPFNATDVAYSYNLMLSGVGYAYGDYWFLMDRVEVVNATAVDFFYKPGMGPDYDFAGYNAHGWGIAMLPWHQLKNEKITPENWKGKPYSKSTAVIPVSNGGDGLECLGPYEPIEYVAGSYVKLQLRPEYIAALGWPNTLPQYYILKLIPDDSARWNALNNLEVDAIEYPIKPDHDWQGMDPNKFRIYTFKYPAMHPLWMNLKNPILSNRYVRLAIAHAIPYPKIFNDILPGWGVSTAYYGKTFILPIHEAFDTELGNYEYNIAKAQQYMDMWRYSQATLDPTKGPRGDHDFNGHVEVADFPIWATWIGKTPSQWKFTPGNDIDPDNNNDGAVNLDDYTSWSANFGKEYPFYKAW